MSGNNSSCYILDSVITEVINLYCLNVILTLTVIKSPEVCNWNELQAKE